MDRTSNVASNVAAALAHNKLGTTRITQFALSAAATLTVVAGVVPTGYAVTGIIGIPAAFVLLGVVLLIFCVGYNAMSRRISNAGAFYAYIAQGISRPMGVAAAWVALLAYNLLQVGLYGIFGALGAPLLNGWLHTNLAWWGWALIAWAIVAILGLMQVEFNGSVLGILMVAEVVVILVYFAAFVSHPAHGVVTATTFLPNHLFVAGFGALMVIAVTGFVGFESAAFYSEEAKDSRRTVPKATYAVVAMIAVLYCLASWAMSVVTGPDQIVAAAQKQSGELVFNLATQTLGAAWGTIGHALLLTSVIAAMISYHTSASRYVFSLGREGVLPSGFGRTLPKTGAPLWGSVSQTIIGFIVIVSYALAGLDPLVNLFFWLGTTGGFGVLLLLTATSAAVIGYFRKQGGESLWRAAVAPFIAFAALAAAIVVSVINFANLLGVAPDSPARWAFPAAFVVVAIGGLLWATVLRSRRPDVYEHIGLGVTAETGRSTSYGQDGDSYERTAGSLL
ncbi:MAG TPA: APC family permease [Pseudonocardiaceae bacterium]|jgi:amino acid transporter|nr:APC family permease [Pseudonocardiaceae bacterium]